MEILYLTDAHGNVESYVSALAIAAKKDIDNIIFGGDTAPNFLDSTLLDDRRSSNSIENYRKQQALFTKNILLGVFRKFKKHNPEKNIYIMPGNDDAKEIIEILNKAEKKNILKQMHGKIHKLGDYSIYGYSFVNPTPFFLKDWEKSEKEINKDLSMITGMGMKKTIMAFHAPPFASNLDVLHSGEHVGSIAIRKFIENNQPLLTLHGHIHESPKMSGAIKDRIGKTLCINPGSSGEELHAALIDLKNMEVKMIKPS